MHFDEELDCSGLLCPLPVLRGRKKLMSMDTGATLKILATDRMAEIDLPHFCAETGHDYLGCKREEAVTAHYLRRGPFGFP